MAFDMLSQLPGELVDHICSFLSMGDVHNVRFTCKTIKEKSDRQFMVLHFGVTTVMLTTGSLQTLLKLIKNPKIKAVIKQLQVVLVTFITEQMPELNGEPFTVEETKEISHLEYVTQNEMGPKTPHETVQDIVHVRVQTYQKTLHRQRRRMYRQLQNDQNKLRTKSLDVKLLTEALRNLPAVDSIAIVDSCGREDRPWGLREVVDKIGTWPATATMEAGVIFPNPGHHTHQTWGNASENVYREFKTICAHSIGAVLGAIRESGVNLRGGLHFGGAPHTLQFSEKPSSRKLSSTSTPAKTFAKSLITPSELRLSELRAFSIAMYKYSKDVYNPVPHDVEPFHWLWKFLPLMTCLRQLWISGGGITREQRFFRKWVNDSFCLPNLRHLSLNNIYIEVPILYQVLDTHRASLQTFEAQDCPHLKGHYWYILEWLLDFPSMLAVHIYNETMQPTGHRYRFHIQESTHDQFDLKLRQSLYYQYQTTHSLPWRSN